MMDQKHIGYFLKKLRKEKGVTQEQLSEMLAVSSRTVSRWETGANLPDLSILIELSEYYDVSINNILNAERNNDMDNELKETLQNVADYDELKKMKSLTAGKFAFAVTFITCGLSISFQLMLTHDLRFVLGETIIMLIGGILYFSLMIKNGAWDTVKNTRKNNLIISMISSLVFSIMIFFMLRDEAALSKVAWMTAIFFIGISITSYAVLRLISYLSQKNEKRNI